VNISVSSVSLPGIEKIGENPLPALRNPVPSRKGYRDNTLRDEDMEGWGDNVGARTLPYLVQDRYDRNKKPGTYKTIVMDNGILRAEFLADFGGRLRSLYNHTEKRELLFANPVIQPGNLAIRNAWLSGGIEWNVGQLGHTFTTCSPLFFAKISDGKGYEFLRMYEYERQKKVFWSVDFHLPGGSAFLEAYVRIVNDRSEDTPMYWWTNTAVREVDGTRVFCPAGEALCGDEAGMLHWADENNVKPGSEAWNNGPLFLMRAKLPHLSNAKGEFTDSDVTYTKKTRRSYDYFYQNPADIKSPWEAALYPDGFVFFERSTQPLRYRKLFVWGNNSGGRHWCDYLALPGKGDYVEIQAGLAPTQGHGLVMKANSTIAFTQLFGAAYKGDTKKLYASYDEAHEYTGALVEKELSAEKVLEARGRHELHAAAEPACFTLLHNGSGWGALEAMRREKTGGAIPKGFLFPQRTIGREQLPWLTLLETGKLPALPERGLPVSYMTDKAWKPLLEKAPGEIGGKPTGADNFLAVMLYEELEIEAALSLWQKEAAKGDVLALRNLACAAQWKCNIPLALEYMERAFGIEKGEIDQAFAEEYLKLLLKQKEYQKMWDVYRSLPASAAASERVQVLTGYAAAQVGEFDFLETLFTRDLAIIQEGETSLSDIWFYVRARELAKKRGVPYTEEILKEATRTLNPPVNIDFRMKEEN
jgi:hypothetical protein